MKKNDFILIAIILVTFILLSAGFRLTQRDGRTVRITCNDNILGDYPLDENNEINVPYSNKGYNIVSINNGSAGVTDADCPDHICVRHPSISSTGETIVCLPHKLVVKIID